MKYFKKFAIYMLTVSFVAISFVAFYSIKENNKNSRERKQASREYKIAYLEDRTSFIRNSIHALIPSLGDDVTEKSEQNFDEFKNISADALNDVFVELRRDYHHYFVDGAFTKDTDISKSFMKIGLIYTNKSESLFMIQYSRDTCFYIKASYEKTEQDTPLRYRMNTTISATKCDNEASEFKDLIDAVNALE